MKRKIKIVMLLVFVFFGGMMLGGVVLEMMIQAGEYIGKAIYNLIQRQYGI